MSAYGWPGNIRELDNVLQSAFVLGEGPCLTLDELPPELRGEAPPDGFTQAVPEPITADLASLERARLVDAWRTHAGNRAAMAAALGLSRSTLYRRLRAHGLL